jgi:predicted N-acyltransferase
LNDNIDISFINNIDNISTNDWLNLNSSNCPFIKHEFFSALEKSLSVSAKQGWQPHHLVVKTENELSAVMPMYLKSHSWGEYVFDWEWADFFKRNGIDYYPKLVATLPFTPVFSEKILSSKFILNDVIKPLIAYCQNENISSWHILYCDELQTNLSEDVYQRHTVQFHWFNRDYNSFDDFINTFTSRKRKNTRKERQSIIHQGITIRQLKNKEISQNDLKFFYLTYQLT